MGDNRVVDNGNVEENIENVEINQDEIEHNNEEEIEEEQEVDDDCQFNREEEELNREEEERGEEGNDAHHIKTNADIDDDNFDMNNPFENEGMIFHYNEYGNSKASVISNNINKGMKSGVKSGVKNNIENGIKNSANKGKCVFHSTVYKTIISEDILKRAAEADNSFDRYMESYTDNLHHPRYGLKYGFKLFNN